MNVRVLVAEDHPEFRNLVSETLDEEPDFQIVAATGSLAEAYESARNIRPEVAVVTVGGRSLDGLNLIERLAESVPETIVIAISLHADSRYQARAHQAGARGYVLKGEISEALVDTIRSVRSQQPRP
jgi:DNA-binding NarL/FixJ family response regulator